MTFLLLIPIFGFTAFAGKFFFFFFCLIFLVQFCNFFCSYGLVLDKFSFLLLILVLWFLKLLSVIGCKYNISKKGAQSYMKNIIFLSVFLVLSFSVSNFLGFYIFFEMSLIPLFFLILGWGYQPERLQAAHYLFMYTVMGSLPLLLVFFFMENQFSLFWPSLLSCQTYSENALMLGSFVVMVAMMIKLPAYGLHLWLPKAHVEAPVAGSMFLAAVMLKLGVYGVYRLLFFFKVFVGVMAYWWASFLFMGAVLSSLVAIRQCDMKSMVAYSSVSHMGILMGGLVLFKEGGMKGIFIVVFAHGFCSSALFFLVNLLYERVFSRQINLSSGIVSIFYGVGLWSFFFLAMNFSAPPLLSLPGELMIFFHILGENYIMFSCALISSFFVGLFSVYFFSSIFHGKLSEFWSLFTFSELQSLVFLFHVIPSIFLVLKIEILWF